MSEINFYSQLSSDSEFVVDLTTENAVSARNKKTLQQSADAQM
jgi:hypothetical protein